MDDTQKSLMFVNTDLCQLDTVLVVAPMYHVFFLSLQLKASSEALLMVIIAEVGALLHLCVISSNL